MQLVACVPPSESLMPAPLSSLCTTQMLPRGTWTGYWSSDGEVYFAKCRSVSGAESWFRLEDTPAEKSEQSVAAEPRAEQATRSAHHGTDSVTVMVLRSSKSSRPRSRDAVIVKHRR